MARRTLLVLTLLTGLGVCLARPWSAEPVRQAGTGRLLARLWLPPWRRDDSNIISGGAVVRRLEAADLQLRQADLTRWHIMDSHIRDADLAWARGEHMSVLCSSFDRVRLVAARLTRVRLTSVTITESSLMAAQAAGILLSNCRLQTVDLRDADLRGAALQQVSLSGVDLRGADLRDAAFTNCDLRGARLEGVRLDGARYAGNTYWPTSFDPQRHGLVQAERPRTAAAQSDERLALGPGATVPQPVRVGPSAQLAGHQMVGTSLDGLDLRRACLRDALLCFAGLANADLRGADLRGADLTGANLAGADLSGADLAGAILVQANYNECTRWPAGSRPASPPKPLPTVAGQLDQVALGDPHEDADGGSLRVASATTSTASWMMAQTP